MSQLLPNIEDLLASLPETKAAAEARELAVAASSVADVPQLDMALSAVVSVWLGS